MADNSIKSINNVISKLKKIQNRFDKINYWYIRYSLNWIKNRANTLLDQRTNGYNSSNAREWNVFIENGVGKLENADPNSGAIEFGIGIIGSQGGNSKAKNDPRIVAMENNYQYMVNDHSQTNWGWTFQLPNGQYIYTRGYGGKSFLFDSLMEYINMGKAYEFYQKAFDKVMKGIAK